MIDEQSSASGHDYAADRSAIGAGGGLMVISRTPVELLDLQEKMSIEFIMMRTNTIIVLYKRPPPPPPSWCSTNITRFTVVND